MRRHLEKEALRRAANRNAFEKYTRVVLTRSMRSLKSSKSQGGYESCPANWYVCKSSCRVSENLKVTRVRYAGGRCEHNKFPVPSIIILNLYRKLFSFVV